jgi:hypothetical protein
VHHEHVNFGTGYVFNKGLGSERLDFTITYVINVAIGSITGHPMTSTLQIDSKLELDKIQNNSKM